ncbi:MAG TPA: ARMT1-like domain-containing protein [Thermodesulfovibrionales bacterium]|nr:ARMT1-like domain-containing protein [Thermodesulfovibrionales bacterium]
MRIHLDCFPCFLRQSLIALRHGTKDLRLQEEIVKAVLADIERADTSRPPAYATTFIHRRIREMLGEDPFRDIKSEYNQIALGLYSSLKKMVEESGDPLWTASRLAIAGNVIDFGIFTSVDVEGTVKRALQSPLAVDDYESFKAALSPATGILYLLDNAGEIVFDRILIETLASEGKKVTAVVKGAPVINDCTAVDAVEAGLNPPACEVIDNGSDAVGTILEWTSPGFRQRYAEAPFIISKGQGNFETLRDLEKTIYYLFQSKCEVVSKELGLSLGSMILKKSESRSDSKS